MTFPDTSLERTGVDPDVTAMVHGADPDHAHLPADNDKANTEAAAPIAERVYAPASERVPVAPVPGHREMVEHTDEHTPERIAAGLSSEPSFTRVDRPSAYAESDPTRPGDTPAAPGYQASPNRSFAPGTGPSTAGASSSPTYPATPKYAPPGGYPGTPAYQGTPNYQAYPALPEPSSSIRPALFFGLGVSWLTVVGTSVGVWLFLRWRRERNKPINRLRRQARQAATLIRDRVPTSRDEAVQPALGLSAALASSLIVLWQQAQSRREDVVEQANHQTAKAARRADKAAHHAVDAVSDADWQKQLAHLKKRWSPRRVELEKISISRH